MLFYSFNNDLSDFFLKQLIEFNIRSWNSFWNVRRNRSIWIWSRKEMFADIWKILTIEWYFIPIKWIIALSIWARWQKHIFKWISRCILWKKFWCKKKYGNNGWTRKFEWSSNFKCSLIDKYCTFKFPLLWI